MSDGFLGRWSRRKLDARDGRSLAPEPPAEAVDTPTSVPAVPPYAAIAAAPTAPPAVPVAPVAASGDGEPPPPPPTMADVQALTSESDFSRFAARDVATDVKSAALKKLFADPRYNVMDGLDVYIDDYSKPDPLPDSMLRQLAGAAFLGLFDEPPAEAAGGAPPDEARDVANNPDAQSVAQSTSVFPDAEPPHDADPDLRLQQDDAPAAGGTGQGAA